MASGRVVLDVEPGKPLALDVLLSELWLSNRAQHDRRER